MKGQTVDFLIVGAGLYGATAARLLSDAGRTVLVLERREEVGGNCHDKLVQGVRVSTYGGHIFHTYSARIWEFVNRFAQWIPYTHRVKAMAGGRLYSFPPNLTTYEQLGIAPNAPERDDVLRRTFFEGYTAKQWGIPASRVDPAVLRRIPFRMDHDDRYFTDLYQGLPAQGYTAMIREMLKGVWVRTGIDYLENEHYWNAQAAQVIYTGALDEFYRYDMGRLPYRSLRFEHIRHEADHYLPAATVNYCDADVPHTRLMDWGYFWPKDVPHTIVTSEYPAEAGEPYYPVNNERNNALHTAYMDRVKSAEWLHIGGRLGKYQYWNMDQAIGAAMALVERLV